MLGTVLIGWFGFFRVAHAVASIGPAGFAAVCAWQMVLFTLLGLCWFVLLPAQGAWTLHVAIWGRMVRDAAGGCLPFSLVGGFVFGARAVTLFGVAWPWATASTVVDLAAEFLAQIGLMLTGVIILASRSPESHVTLPLGLGLIAALAAGAGFFWLQRGTESPLIKLSRRLLGGWVHDADGQMSAIQAVLTRIYGTPWRVAACCVLHLVSWFGTGVASWLAFRLLGATLDLWAALGIEALLHAMLAMAILVPGYAGVQEAAYVAVGALFGQPAELCLAVSLLRRARDVALGVPILLLWQGIELRRKARGLAKRATPTCTPR